jgi:hypothetical protein
VDQIERLVASYKDAAREYGNAMEAGDYRLANKNHDILAAIYRELRTRGLGAQRALLPLLNSEDISVRAWAGIHALDFAPAEGQPVVEDIAKTCGFRGLSARMHSRSGVRAVSRSHNPRLRADFRDVLSVTSSRQSQEV